MIHKIDWTVLAATVRELQGLSSEQKSALIELINGQKKYGLVWENKPENVEERLREEIPVLREVKEHAIVSDELVAPNHILIEGDNLEALTTLSYTHEGKIDIIYIDPPYNTGNKDEGAFIYNDHIVDSEDAYIHSKWLSFIDRRLKIAKKLLKQDGVLFISIGDDEQANLKLLCDSYFSCLGVLPRIAKKGSNQGTWFRPTKDYILVYTIRKELVAGFVGKGDSEEKNYPYMEESSQRRYRKAHSLYQASLDPLRGCKNQRYYIETPDGTLIIPPGPHLPMIASEGEQIVPVTGDDKVWRWSRDSYIEKKKQIMFSKSKKSPLIDSNGNHTDWNVYEKKYEDEEKDQEDNTLPDDVVYDCLNSLGTTLLNEMGIKFPFSKPYQLVKYLIELTNKNKNSIILDFFAGSGTTLHATMQLNAEDGGHRKCILVTNNENGICENVTYERNKRVINGYTTLNGDKIEGLHENNLRYYKADFLSRDRSMSNMRQLVNASTDLLCIKEDLYSEQNKFGRWKIPSQIARYFSDGQKHMLIVYDERLVEQLPKMINEIDFGKERLKIYIFSPSRYAFDDEFYEVQDKVQLVALPAAIYDAYSKVLPKRKPKLLDVEEEKEMKEEITLDDLFDLPDEAE